MSALNKPDRLRLRLMLAYACEWAGMRSDHKFCTVEYAAKQVRGFERTLAKIIPKGPVK